MMHLGKTTGIWGRGDKNKLVGLFTFEFCMELSQMKNLAYQQGHLNSNSDLPPKCYV